jgi:phenylpropionate dioxygenase-like ring-hydroxylating dioxygenase large terminal subunit
VRAEDGLRAYYNSCLHRGTKLKASGTNGWSPSIKCPYHAWEWNLEGTVKNIPCDWEFPQLDREKACLPQVKVDSWNGLVFINFDKDAQPLLDYLEVVPDHFANWDLTSWYAHIHVRKRLPGNWKLAQDAFLEAYHTPVVHPEMTLTVSDHNMQHDILSDHVTRDLCAMASPSPTATRKQTQQELLDTMVMGDRSTVADRLMVPEGKTARFVMAEQLRQQMATQYGLDYSDRSVPEVIDSLKYTIFPNLFVVPSVGFPLILTFRPDGHDHDRSIFDVMIMRPRPTDGSDWQVAEVVEIGENDSYRDVPGFDPFFGLVLDQDTDIMRWQREGMYASGKGAESLSIYQEARIRHVHDTLDKYLAK